MTAVPAAVLGPPFFANALGDWALAWGVTLVVFVALVVARRLLGRYHARLVKYGRLGFMHAPLAVFGRTSPAFMLALALYAGLGPLALPARIDRAATLAITVIVFWQAGIWLSAIFAAWLERQAVQRAPGDHALASSMAIFAPIARVLIWVLVLLLALDNLGVNITALVGGLGIGGVAVALAVQNILGDLFASLSITLDKPFVVGDFLSVGEFLGEVRHIGIKSTRLLSLSGEEIAMSNADLLGSRIRNYGRMAERRVVFTVKVDYGTAADELARLGADIRRIVEAQRDVRFDRSHFSAFTLEALDVETVYYVLSPDFNRYMDIQQAINLEIFREFARRGIAFASPSLKIQIGREAGDDVGAAPAQRENRDGEV